jgi:hypothetical protein
MMTTKILIQIHLVDSMKTATAGRQALLSGVVNEEPEQPPQPIRRNESKKRGRYTHPTKSKEDQSEANARIVEALHQVRKSAHSQADREGKRDSATLYVETSSTTQMNKIYARAARPWIQSFKRFGWRGLQFQG